MPDQFNQQQPYQQAQPAQPAYQQPYQQSYQQPAPPYAPADQTITTGEWVLNLFLVAIPIAGLILLLVWAFGSETPATKSNWAKANLIWILIGIGLSVLMSMVLGVSIAGLASYR